MAAPRFWVESGARSGDVEMHSLINPFQQLDDEDFQRAAQELTQKKPIRRIAARAEKEVSTDRLAHNLDEFELRQFPARQ